MAVMFILLPVALIFSGAAVLVFLWAARAGQFDDLKTPSLRILHEDEETPHPRAGGRDPGPTPRRRAPIASAEETRAGTVAANEHAPVQPPMPGARPDARSRGG